MAARVRPARRPRWRRYAPALGLLLAALPPLLAPGLVTDPLTALGVSLHAARITLAAFGVALVILLAKLTHQPPVPVLMLGTAATIAGASMLQGPLVALPLLLAGLAWITYHETRRAFQGITLSPQGLTLHRVLRTPLIIRHEDIHHAHTTMHGSGNGTLILETAHGTVTAPHLPSCEAIQARIEARLNPTPVRATGESLSTARHRIEDLLRA